MNSSALIRYFGICFFIITLLMNAEIVLAEDGPLPVEAYTHPQRLVPVQGRRKLNLFCLGHGSPTVLLDAGTGGGTVSWRFVQGDIAKKTTVCSYDRAGYGFSDRSTRTSDAANAVEDMHHLVASAGLLLPLVLVGHSNGGIYATLYAKTYPNDVAGMVLVDPGYTGQQHFERYGLASHQAEELVQANASYIRQARACLVAAKKGELTRSEESNAFCLDTSNEKDGLLHAAINRQESKPAYQEANLSEFENTFNTIAGDSVNDREDPLEASEFASMPLVVLTASDHPAPVHDFSASDQSIFYAFWKRSHDDLAMLSTDGKNIVVANSGHFIQRDQPNAVVQQIDEIISKIRFICSAQCH